MDLDLRAGKAGLTDQASAERRASDGPAPPSGEPRATTLSPLVPYLLLSLLFGALGGLVALDAALTSFGLLPFFNGLRWLRVHVLVLGLLAELLFGLLPPLVAAGRGLAGPAPRWDIWLALNLGLLALLIGIPLVNAAFILVGGALVFAASGLLLLQLRSLQARPSGGPGAGRGEPSGRGFYLAGLASLLVGVTVGTGLWLGWPAALRIAVPVETHIHANAFGFLALTFAGLLVDLYPALAGRPLASGRTCRAILGLMALGVLGLVLGPWLNLQPLILAGVALHFGATLWLLARVVRPLLGQAQAWTPGLLHLVTAYVWFLAPVVAAPLVVLGVLTADAASIEQSVPQALIYGWALQFGYPLLPYALARALEPDRPAALGGSWLSLLGGHLGAVLLWASVFVQPSQALLFGAAYLCWLLSLLPILAQSWRIVRRAGPAAPGRLAA
jgi:hypothetical protein